MDVHSCIYPCDKCIKPFFQKNTQAPMFVSVRVFVRVFIFTVMFMYVCAHVFVRLFLFAFMLLFASACLCVHILFCVCEWVTECVCVESGAEKVEEGGTE